MAKTGGGFAFGPETHITLISANQKAFALLAQIIFAVAVRDRGQTAIHCVNLGNGFGDEILVLGGLQGQFKPCKPRHFAAPKTRGIDHPLGFDVPLGGAHDPAAIGLRFGGCYRSKAVNFRAVLARTGRISSGHTRGIDITAFRFPHNSANAIKINQRMQLFRFRARHLGKIHPVKLGF